MNMLFKQLFFSRIYGSLWKYNQMFHFCLKAIRFLQVFLPAYGTDVGIWPFPDGKVDNYLSTNTR